MTDVDTKAHEEWAATMKNLVEADTKDEEAEELPKPVKMDVIVGSDEEVLLQEAVVATVTRQLPDLVKNDPDVAWLALVFLRFRGYAVVDAVTRLGRFLEFRAKYSLQNQQTLSAVQKEILLEENRAILPGTDKEGHGLILVCLRNSHIHEPKLVLQTIHWLIINLLRKGGPAVQQKGSAVIMDMEGASFKNFDSRLMSELRPALTKCFPLRVTTCYIVHPNSVADVVIPVYKTFNEKMGARIQILRDVSELHQYVDKTQLPPFLGGTLNYDFKKWVNENC